VVENGFHPGDAVAGVLVSSNKGMEMSVVVMPALQEIAKGGIEGLADVVERASKKS